MDRLHHNLTSGSSYLTQHSADPEVDGEILYDNMTAIAERLFGEDYTDADMEIIIDRVSDGTLTDVILDENCDIDAAVKAVDASAKQRGGTGWL